MDTGEIIGLIIILSYPVFKIVLGLIFLVEFFNKDSTKAANKLMFDSIKRNLRQYINAAIQFSLAILIFICVFDVEYEYYEFVRYLSLCGFVWLAFCSFKDNNQEWGFVFAFLAILFQPLFKISLGSTLWSIIDVLVALMLFTRLYIFLKGKIGRYWKSWHKKRPFAGLN